MARTSAHQAADAHGLPGEVADLPPGHQREGAAVPGDGRALTGRRVVKKPAFYGGFSRQFGFDQNSNRCMARGAFSSGGNQVSKSVSRA